MNSQELLFEMVDRDPAYFESMIIARFLLDRDFFNQMRVVVEVNAAGVPSPSFTQPVHEGLMKAIGVYHDSGGPANPISNDHLWRCLQSIAQKGLLPPNELQETWNMLATMVANAMAAWEMVLQCTRNACTYWLKQNRKGLILQLADSERWASDKIMDELRRENVFIDSVTRTEQITCGFDEAMDRIQPDVVRLKSSLVGLNVAIGGGFGMGEGSLVISASGGGKTVLSTQLARDFALLNKKGVYLTTERSQGSEKLVRRIISSACSIPFSTISGGINMQSLSPTHQESIRAVREKINDRNIQFVEWFRVGKTKNIGSGLREEVEKAASKMGGLDYFIFDWIGGTLGVTDPKLMRFFYQDAADEVALMSGDWNCAGIATTQADAAKGKNNMTVDAQACSENKTLDRNMTNVIGATAFYNKAAKEGGEGGGGEESLYERKQWLFVSKCRMGVGGYVPVSRDFHFQRFGPYMHEGPGR